MDLRPATSPEAQITMEAEVSGSLRRTPSRPPRSALGLDGVALHAGACGGLQHARRRAGMAVTACAGGGGGRGVRDGRGLGAAGPAAWGGRALLDPDISVGFPSDLRWRLLTAFLL